MCLPLEHDYASEGGDEEPRDDLEPDEEPAVRGHLHEEVLLVAVDLRHALGREKGKRFYEALVPVVKCRLL